MFLLNFIINDDVVSIDVLKQRNAVKLSEQVYPAEIPACCLCVFQVCDDHLLDHWHLQVLSNNALMKHLLSVRRT